jgi:hypothetical protein
MGGRGWARREIFVGASFPFKKANLGKSVNKPILIRKEDETGVSDRCKTLPVCGCISKKR